MEFDLCKPAEIHASIGDAYNNQDYSKEALIISFATKVLPLNLFKDNYYLL